MRIFVGVVGAAFILVILMDAFESIVLPRRVIRKFRLARGFYRTTWLPWSSIARRLKSAKRREYFLSFFGPLSLIFLLLVWAISLIFGFAVVQWAFGSALQGQGNPSNFLTDLYMSGTTFFTLGLGDVTPITRASRALTVVEGGTGFGFLALVIGYLPVTYQAFSRREVNISLLDARAGSPSSAVELLRRHAAGQFDALELLLEGWERWAAELMESHLSYPVLCYFRSQHDNQSWLGALTTVLDACALVMVGIEGVPEWQARLTFAMARHAVVDISQVFNIEPKLAASDRLPAKELVRLRMMLTKAGVRLAESDAADKELARLRGMYEPYINALSRQLMMSVPSWMPTAKQIDNWQTSAWERKPGEACQLDWSKKPDQFISGAARSAADK